MAEEKSRAQLARQLTKEMEQLANNLVTDPDKLKQFGETWAGGFHDYSLGNLLLIMWQKPNATLCAGFKQWQKHERYVKKGEHGIKILAPWKFKVTEVNDAGEEEEKSVMRFYPVTVFDVTQTDGKPLEIGHSEMIKGEVNITLADIATLFDYRVEYSNGLHNGRADGETIWISERGNDLAEVATYIHELAHNELGHAAIGCEVPREVRELEAEAVSYLVCSTIGIENDKARYYISHWGGTPESLGRSGSRILKTAEKIARKVKEVL